MNNREILKFYVYIPYANTIADIKIGNTTSRYSVELISDSLFAKIFPVLSKTYSNVGDYSFYALSVNNGGNGYAKYGTLIVTSPRSMIKTSDSSTLACLSFVYIWNFDVDHVVEYIGTSFKYTKF